MNQLEVQIMGQSYRLGCPEDGAERLQAAVQKVDAAMCAIRDAGKVKARDRIAVLAALNLAFDLSDRPVEASPAAGPAVVAAAPLPSAAPAAASTPTSDAGGDDQLASLLARLDDALRDDGRLL
jgi:cell division protein ZapA